MRTLIEYRTHFNFAKINLVKVVIVVSLKMSKIIFSDSLDNLSFELGKNIAKFARIAIQKNGRFSVAFSGGSLPSIVAKGLLALNGTGDQPDYSTWIILQF